MCQVYQEKLQLNIVKDFQTNLINFVNVSELLRNQFTGIEKHKNKRKIMLIEIRTNFLSL